MSKGQEIVTTPDKLREILSISQKPVHLETITDAHDSFLVDPVEEDEEEDSHLGDFIEDRGALAPAEAASHQLLKEQVEAVLGSLTGRERRVLQLRFGLEDSIARTLEEVGREFNVERERIRQIEAKALRKLRHPSRSSNLRDYLYSSAARDAEPSTTWRIQGPDEIPRPELVRVAPGEPVVLATGAQPFVPRSAL